MDNQSLLVRVPKRWLRIALIVGVASLIVAPLTAWATHSFDDVPSSQTFHEDIAWLDANNVTRGCNPPDNNLFCPDDNVTRGQMSAFMRRLTETFGVASAEPVLDFNSGVAITGGDPVEVLSVEVTPKSEANVVLNAHVTIEKPTNPEGRLEVQLRRDSCAGDLLAVGRWRANANSEGTFHQNTLSLTGADVTSSDTTYALCVRKGEGIGPDATAHMRGLTASWSPTRTAPSS